MIGLNYFCFLAKFTTVLLFLSISTFVFAGCRKKDGYYSVGDYCDAYIRCEGRRQVGKVQFCEDGHVFNEFGNVSRIRCELPHNVDCETRPNRQKAKPIGECPHQNALIGRCSTFLHCEKGRAYEKNCPTGLVFNNEKGYCDWIDLVPDCENEIIDELDFICRPSKNPAQNFDDHFRFASKWTDKFYVCMKINANGERNLSPRLITCDGKFNPVTFECDK